MALRRRVSDSCRDVWGEGYAFDVVVEGRRGRRVKVVGVLWWMGVEGAVNGFNGSCAFKLCGVEKSGAATGE